MGRTMQLMVIPRPDRRWEPDPGKLFVEQAHYALINAGQALPNRARPEFSLVRFVSQFSNYVDESLWLDPRQLEQLAEEFASLVQVADGVTFSKNVSAGHLHTYWRERARGGLGWNDRYPLRDLLTEAALLDCWGHFML